MLKENDYKYIESFIIGRYNKKGKLTATYIYAKDIDDLIFRYVPNGALDAALHMIIVIWYKMRAYLFMITVPVTILIIFVATLFKALSMTKQQRIEISNNREPFQQSLENYIRKHELIISLFGLLIYVITFFKIYKFLHG